MFVLCIMFETWMWDNQPGGGGLMPGGGGRVIFMTAGAVLGSRLK